MRWLLRFESRFSPPRSISCGRFRLRRWGRTFSWCHSPIPQTLQWKVSTLRSSLALPAPIRSSTAIPKPFHRNNTQVRGLASRDSPLRLLNKSLYETANTCPRLGWYARRHRLPSEAEAATNPMREFLRREGQRFEAHVCAHKFGYSQENDDGTEEESLLWQTDASATPPNNLAVVEEASPVAAAKATARLMKQDDPGVGASTAPAIDTILQPTFVHEQLVARPDAVVRSSNAEDSDDKGLPKASSSWEVVEIKSSTAKSVRKKIPDLAFSVCVARRAGAKISGASLVVVDPSYVHRGNGTPNSTAGAASLLEDERDSRNSVNDETNLLYTTIDCTELVNKYIIDHRMEESIASIEAITRTGKDSKGLLPPPMEYKLACGKCELLGVECGPRQSTPDAVLPLRHGIWELPRLSKKQFPPLLERALPTLELGDLDDADFCQSLLTPNQMRFYQAVLRNRPLVDRPGLRKRLGAIAADASSLSCVVGYLDFEAVSMLNPPHPGMVPYETMVTQYSLHQHHNTAPDTQQPDATREFPMGELSHSEYLSDPQTDCRRELLERLLDDLGYSKDSGSACEGDNNAHRGPILVYSSYEKTQLNKLAKLFPEHSASIADVVDRRLVDLEKIIKDCVSHPEFRGRSSIKVTLPALVPGFQSAYKQLQLKNEGIAEGGAAAAAYADLVSGVRGDPATVHRTKRALLEYCKLDTLALVEIHRALWKLVSEE